MTQEAKEPKNERIKPETTPKDPEETGNWMWLCPYCTMPALIFPGEQPPKCGIPIEELECDIKKDGYRSKHRHMPICSQCGMRLGLAHDGGIEGDHVYEVDRWCRGMGKPISAYGYKIRGTQKSPEFWEKDKYGAVIPSKEKQRRLSVLGSPNDPEWVERQKIYAEKIAQG